MGYVVAPSLPRLGYASIYREAGGSGHHGVFVLLSWQLLDLTPFLNPEVAFDCHMERYPVRLWSSYSDHSHSECVHDDDYD